MSARSVVDLGRLALKGGALAFPNEDCSNNESWLVLTFLSRLVSIIGHQRCLYYSLCVSSCNRSTATTLATRDDILKTRVIIDAHTLSIRH